MAMMSVGRLSDKSACNLPNRLHFAVTITPLFKAFSCKYLLVQNDYASRYLDHETPLFLLC